MADVNNILEKLVVDVPPLTDGAPSKVLVAMSGGVDSSVVAAALKYMGYDVIGATLQLYHHGTAMARQGACCAGADIADAKSVATKMGFRHYVLDYEDRFRQKVIDDFVDGYRRGETPLPCVRCNQSVKFDDLFAMAKDLGMVALATGHYVRRVEKNGAVMMMAAGDDATPMMVKDQSYFLFATRPEQLQFLRFPLGGLTKDKTRELAEFFGLKVAHKPDSQDICFVPKGDYRAVVEHYRPDAMKAGDIVLADGSVVGQHQGVVGYTVGQRRGIGIGGRKAGGASQKRNISQGNNIKQKEKAEHPALYVLAVNPDDNKVVVGTHSELMVDEISLRECYWLVDDVGGRDDLWVKYRSTMAVVRGRVMITADGARVRFDEPAFGVAAGQALVVYQKNPDGWRLLGGGFITSQHLQRFLQKAVG